MTWLQKHMRLISSVSIVLWIALVAYFSMQAIRGSVSYPLAALVAIWFVVQVLLRLFIPDRRKPKFSPSSDVDNQLLAQSEGIQNMISLLSELGPNANQMIDDFVSMTVEPGTYSFRTTEEIAIARAWSTRIVRSSYRMPRNQAATNSDICFIPLLLPSKGRLHSDLRVDTTNDGGITTLPLARANAVLVAAIFITYSRTCGLTGFPNSWALDIRSDFEELVAIALRSRHRILVDYGPSPTMMAAGVQAEVVGALLGARTRSVDPNAFAQLERLVELSADHYCIIAEVVRTSTVLKLSYSYRVATSSLSSTLRKAEFWTLTWFRGLGLSSSSGYYEIPLARAKNAKSYHLYVRVPEGSYITSTVVEDINEDHLQRTRSDYVVGTEAYFRPMESGRSDGHLYSRGFSRLPRPSRLRIHVQERPLGSELTTLVAAVLTVGAIALLYAGARDGTYGSDLVTAVVSSAVALTTLVAWYARCISRSALPSLVGLGLGVLTVCTGLAALVLYLLEAARRHTDQVLMERWPIRWEVVAVVQGSVLLISALVFLVRFVRFLGKRW